MPVIFAIIIRLLIYLASMLVGATGATLVMSYLQKRRERKKKKPAKIDFNGFESEAHRHEQ